MFTPEEIERHKRYMKLAQDEATNTMSAVGKKISYKVNYIVTIFKSLLTYFKPTSKIGISLNLMNNIM